MPIYEYECKKCLHRFEVRRGFNDNGGTSCPQCQGDARRLFSPVPIIFKGSGFYVTDHRKNHERPSDDGKADKSKPEKKSENS